MSKIASEEEKQWYDNHMKHWRSWGSWYSWGSPVGLSIFFISIAAIVFVFVKL